MFPRLFGGGEAMSGRTDFELELERLINGYCSEEASSVPDSIKTESERELERLINGLCPKDMSSTPDFILAAYQLDCLKAYENR
jgi:hypothetical protein